MKRAAALAAIVSTPQSHTAAPTASTPRSRVSAAAVTNQRVRTAATAASTSRPCATTDDASTPYIKALHKAAQVGMSRSLLDTPPDAVAKLARADKKMCKSTKRKHNTSQSPAIDAKRPRVQAKTPVHRNGLTSTMQQTPSKNSCEKVNTCEINTCEDRIKMVIKRVVVRMTICCITLVI